MQISDIEERLMAMQKRKDKVMDISREIIRAAGKSITQVHAKNTAEAAAILKKMKALIEELGKNDGGFEYYSLQAYQEYVEAFAFYTLVKEKRLVSRKEMGVSDVSYLLGIMDLTGELKREAIDALRDGRPEQANVYYDFMKNIYDSTRALRFADSLVPDFRRKQDTARIQIEGLATELLGYDKKTR